jgi:hypothetical protein
LFTFSKSQTSCYSFSRTKHFDSIRKLTTFINSRYAFADIFRLVDGKCYFNIDNFCFFLQIEIASSFSLPNGSVFSPIPNRNLFSLLSLAGTFFIFFVFIRIDLFLYKPALFCCFMSRIF